MLERARELGLLGPPPVEEHIAHTMRFARALDVADPGPIRALDLGSGGGVPGLILALGWPRSTWTLLDAGERRCAFLREAVAALGEVGRIAVVRARAEETGRDPRHRGVYDLVTARSFGPAAVTAECAAPLLRRGGVLLVSEPPEAAPGRWPPGPLATVGLVPRSPIGAHPGVMVLEQVNVVSDRFPRRVGIPGKRPLWR